MCMDMYLCVCRGHMYMSVCVNGWVRVCEYGMFWAQVCVCECIYLNVFMCVYVFVSDSIGYSVGVPETSWGIKASGDAETHLQMSRQPETSTYLRSSGEQGRVHPNRVLGPPRASWTSQARPPVPRPLMATRVTLPQPALPATSSQKPSDSDSHSTPGLSSSLWACIYSRTIDSILNWHRLCLHICSPLWAAELFLLCIPGCRTHKAPLQSTINDVEWVNEWTNVLGVSVFFLICKLWVTIFYMVPRKSTWDKLYESML